VTEALAATPGSWVFHELQDEVDSRIDPDFVRPQGIRLIQIIYLIQTNGVLLEEICEKFNLHIRRLE
jgi:hypothetical protein